eukprot:408786-Hanusia_phi.AAC.1
MPGARMRRRKKARQERQQQEESHDEEEKAKLFDDDEDEDVSLQVNEKFKERFEYNEKLKDKMKLKELEAQLGDDDSSSTEEDEGDLLTDKMDQQILQTLTKIKTKDPEIYSQDRKFFDSEEEEQEEGEEDGTKKDSSKKPKPKTVVDLERERLMRGEVDVGSDEDAPPKENDELTYPQEQERLKALFRRQEEEGDSDDDLFVPKSKSKEDTFKEDKEYEEFAKDRMAENDPSQTLAMLLKDDDIDEDERFLRNYVLGNQWKEEREVDAHGGIQIDDSEDEEAVKEAEDFEEKYNFRFEQKGSEELVGHARDIEGSVRRQDDRRKEKRKRKQEREKTKLEQQKEELRRLKNLKKQEILDRLKLIEKISGAPHIDSNKVDLEEEFDPDKYDAQMATLYDEEYYNAEEEAHPFADAAAEDFLDAIGYESFEDEDVEEDTENQDDGKEDEAEGEERDYGRDGDGEKKKIEVGSVVQAKYAGDGLFYEGVVRSVSKKNYEIEFVGFEGETQKTPKSEVELLSTREGKKKNKKLSAKEQRELARKEKKLEKEKSDSSKSARTKITDAELESVAQKYGAKDFLDEYYQLDYEDIIGEQTDGVPTRFKYRSSDPVDYGLTPEE